ncbi:MAG TPA: NUDIX hydrolase [Thermomicrobiales bacterium]|jgi:ADP-ribose pyrophosphatase YjhB (NUDIX family)
MITFDRDGIRFHYRVAGVCIHDGYVLLHRADRDEYWALPGGRCELGESSEETLRREMQEELHVPVNVGRLFWVVENFFTLLGRAYHELALLYAIDLPVDHAYLDKTRLHYGVEDQSTDGTPYTLIYAWVPIASLPDVVLHPSFLRTALRNVPAATQHIVQRDP